jgi:hypothetical protein
MYNNSIQGTDKYYWHKYVDTYIQYFKTIKNVSNIVEFGVFKGDSIRWLREYFPNAFITGVDILNPQPEWPVEKNIIYKQLDQGNKDSIINLFRSIVSQIDIIIEDGSHIPQHQASSLALGFSALKSKGLYILEDIHTCHFNSPYFQEYSTNNGIPKANPLVVLLAMQDIKFKNKGINDIDAISLSDSDFFSKDDIINLYNQIDTINIYKRTSLPMYCWKCKSDEYNYRTLSCSCGEKLYKDDDSMTCIITKK